ncbi:MAG: pyruvate dehydrogenase (acetyl-transferring), homodimeric type, partial [Planctomycetaceae bacterium]
IKVLWGSEWDSILEADETGELVRRMGEVVDGQYQKYKVEGGAYIRDHFFNTPYLKSLVAHLSDEQLAKIRRGGHDPEKVYAAYRAAVDHKGAPTVILAKTIKGYGLGEAGEGRNVAHNVKKANEQELREFRNRFGIPISDEDVEDIDFYRPADDDFGMQYLQECRKKLGGYVPARTPTAKELAIPPLDRFDRFLAGTDGKEASTTMAFSQFISQLIKDKELGPRVVPIIPDEARTFGMEGLFRQAGIYAHRGQLYEPVDRHQLMYYKEARDGQILEEGINEAGAMSSFIAAGSAYSNLGFTMMPFYIFYSMFGFQRVGDLIWCAADSRAKGFLIGGTSGRTTLNGEGLQHEDGHSHLIATTVPSLIAYDPAYAYELIAIIQEGMRRMYVDQECLIYYLSVYNENYPMPPMPDGCHEGILKGLYRLSGHPENRNNTRRPQLFGSGTILNETLRAQQMLADRYGIGSDVWSVTSYSELAREACSTQRWNRLHPNEPARRSYLEEALAEIDGPFISSSDNVRLVGDQIREWMPGPYTVLGTDGFGRSDTRKQLRSHFEIDAESIVFTALVELAKLGDFDQQKLTTAADELGIDPEKEDPLHA